jgi:hypothetical protein
LQEALSQRRSLRVVLEIDMDLGVSADRSLHRGDPRLE